MNDKLKRKIDSSAIGENLNRNLLALMNNNDISLTVLSRNTGIAIPTIKRLQSDPTTNPTLTTLLPIAEFFGVSVHQLISPHFDPGEFKGYVENKAHWLRVPIIKWEQTIDWHVNGKASAEAEYVLADVNAGDNPYALIVEEEDWITIPKGSILIINSSIKPSNRDYVVLHKKNAAPTLKQVVLDESKIYLKSLSRFFLHQY